MYVVLEDNKPKLCYSNIYKEVYLFACVAHGITLSLFKHVAGKKNIDDYLENRKKYHKFYQPPKFEHNI